MEKCGLNRDTIRVDLELAGFEVSQTTASRLLLACRGVPVLWDPSPDIDKAPERDPIVQSPERARSL